MTPFSRPLLPIRQRERQIHAQNGLVGLASALFFNEVIQLAGGEDHSTTHSHCGIWTPPHPPRDPRSSPCGPVQSHSESLSLRLTTCVPFGSLFFSFFSQRDWTFPTLKSQTPPPPPATYFLSSSLAPHLHLSLTHSHSHCVPSKFSHPTSHLITLF